MASGANLYGTVHAASSDPVTTIARFQRGIVESDTRFSHSPARHNESGALEAREAYFAPLIDATHDLPYMTRIVIGRHWRSLDDPVREKLVAAFRSLSVTSYAVRFSDLAGVEFTIGTERPVSGGRVEVQTALLEAKSDPVAINYVLHETSDGWRIINVLAEGVSELALKRSQYQQILKSGSPAELLSYMHEQRSDIAAEFE